MSVSGGKLAHGCLTAFSYTRIRSPMVVGISVPSSVLEGIDAKLIFEIGDEDGNA